MKGRLIVILIIFFCLKTSILWGITIEGPFSYRINLDTPVKRIVSLSPAITETLFAIGAGTKIVGATIFDNYPEKAKLIPRVGDFSNPNLEKILQLKPDLVIGIVNIHEKLLIKLLNLGIPCYAFKLYTSLEELYLSIDILGKFTGMEKEAKELIRNIKDEFKILSEKSKKLEKRPRVFLAIWDSPLTTVSKKSYINELIEIAGGENIVSETDVFFPIYSLEKLIKISPDIIIVAEGEGSMGVSKERLLKVLDGKGLEAVKKGNVFEINGDIIFRLSPRVLEGARTLYEIFKKWSEKEE
ncbi:MAG: ABC transporter substrate-binding protein [Synergistetes bacterium]|nr:ABC transporter substrate-binding protein [Synergistota bacterium]MCX8128110.1 ABC transporter substrate-binding protein [Synergistota bacterium]MDW8192486.1 ABC transporter substrate-binding protein [Synergistota bacterium]